MDFQAFRSEFAETVDHCLYFDNASIGPLPRTAGEKSGGFMRLKEKLPLDYAQTIQSTVGPCKQKLGRLINAQPGEIAFCGSIAQGVNLAAWAIPFKEGDNVILCDREFASNVYPWQAMGKKRKVETRMVPNQGGGLTVALLEKHADEKTRAVAVSSVQFADGYRTDLAAIGAWCQSRGVYLAVDTAQSLGVLPMDVKACGIDFMAGCGAKWMLGGFGTGFLYVKKEHIESTEPPFPSADSAIGDPDNIDYERGWKGDAARFETGALNLPGIAALSATLDVCNGYGYDNIYQNSKELCAHFVARLQSMDMELAPGALQPQTRSGIIAVKTDDPAATCAFLNSQKVRCVVREGYIRLGVHGYSTKDEIDQVCALLKEHAAGKEGACAG